MEFCIGCGYGISGQFYHLFINVTYEVELIFTFLDIAFELVKREFIAWLKLSILFTVLLNSIIGQVDEFAFQIFYTKNFARSSSVALFIPVRPKLTIYHANHQIAPHIKFSTIVKKWHQIFLNYKSRFRLFHLLFLDQLLNFFNGLLDTDTSPSVCILCRLDNPKLWFFFPSLIACSKSIPLPIIDIFDMESDRNVLEWVNTLLLVVGLQIPEKGLLVGNFMMIHEVVMDLNFSAFYRINVLFHEGCFDSLNLFVGLTIWKLGAFLGKDEILKFLAD